MTETMRAWLLEKEGTIAAAGDAHDRAGTFPAETAAILTEAGYTSLTVPKHLGGFGMTLPDFLRLQQLLARADGASALCMGWHNGLLYHMREHSLWLEEQQAFLMKEAVAGKLYNAVASERASGSPARGGKPETIAERTEDGWILNGHKAFASMAPVLDYAAITANIEGEGAAQFLVPMQTAGITVEKTWDSIAMRGTASHDLRLENVSLRPDAKIQLQPQQVQPVNGWLLHIPACYLGIAERAFRTAVSFSQSYSPNSLDGTISETAHVRAKLGEMELLLRQSEAVLYRTAEQYEAAAKEDKPDLQPDLAAAKYTVTNNGMRMVDLAMRIGGAGSLSAQSTLQRCYRDIRAGLHNPPMDDIVLDQLADEALKRHS
ncbi:acyl-CoA dehydrogenase family protein [Bacillus daqingensis]|uniref:Acyl-CoA dehydrogenase family protein n=1 Tax=Bacillus daqingensis TaxID=872396 RepID=A0ABV9NWJ9_9BACI